MRTVTPNINYVQYKGGCAVGIGYLFSASNDVQDKSGTSSVQAIRIRHIISTSENMQYKQANHEVLVQGALLWNTFQCMNYYSN